MEPQGTIRRRDWLLSARRELSQAGVTAPAIVAQAILCHVCELPRERLVAYDDVDLQPAQVEEAMQLLSRRLKGEPLAYLIESVEFYGHRLRVTPDVLVPRNETEHLVEFLLDQISATYPRDRSWTLVDVGTGSGAIPLAVGLTDPRVRAVGIDISEAALEVASDNRMLLGLEDRLALLRGDLLAPLTEAAADPHAPHAYALQRTVGTSDLTGRVDAIVSNPPYIDPADMEILSREVLREPEVALFAGAAGEGGTAIHARLLDEAREWLKPGGWLVMEMGIGQARALRRLASAVPGWDIETEVIEDLAGIDRVFAVQRSRDVSL